MNKRIKINIALLALIVLVAAFLFQTGGKQTAEQQSAVTGMDGNSITRISVTRTGREVLRFIKQGNGWRMESPRSARANPTRINTILALLQTRSYAQLDAGDMDLTRFDLSKPAVILKLNRHEFRFGNNNTLEGRRYLLFQDTIHLIDDGLYQQLLQPAEFFVQSGNN